MREKRATEILKQFYGDNAKFREGQLESILSVLNKEKTLVVQKTGWGKSLVYFIATKILREDGAGPSIIVSPLLALMGNQVDFASTVGLNVVTINSSNNEEWDEIFRNLSTYDALIVSPERLANEKFMGHLSVLRDIRLFVVDEAHSISDWGHDFRPDYQRIVRLLDNLPADISILGTTATANNRVIDDAKDQLGDDLHVVRGNLIREKLAIQINPLSTREEKLAWLVGNLRPSKPLGVGQGIIYCLTQRDCETVAEYLARHSISSAAYHAGLDSDLSQARLREFDDGSLRILVSTIKLGMGYDKSDIRFVVHYQIPQNLISYYQQIGRAGRDGLGAYAILLHGLEDDEILEFFISNAQSEPELLEGIIKICSRGAKKAEILSELNVKSKKLDAALKYLMVQEYIYKDGSTYRINLRRRFDIVAERQKQQELNQVRHGELDRLRTFLRIDSCYMSYIADELDAPDASDVCGVCVNCLDQYLIPLDLYQDDVDDATAFLRNKRGRIRSRKMWGDNTRIKENLRMQDGWVLAQEYHSELGQKVKMGKYSDKEFSDELVLASTNYLVGALRSTGVNLVVPVPSMRHPQLVPSFAKKLANNLGVPFVEAVQKTALGSEQKTLMNSPLQERNIRDSISIEGEQIRGKTILLVDDMVDSKWTFTVIAAELLSEGAHRVYPFALVQTGQGD